MLSLLASNPHLAKSVLNITAWLGSPSSDPAASDTPRDCEEELARALCACRNLVGLTFVVSRPRHASLLPMSTDLRRALEGLGGHLKSLSIYGSYWSSGLSEVLGAQCALRVLSVDVGRGARLGVARPPFQLQTLLCRADFEEAPSWDEVEALIAASHHTLTALYLEADHVPSIAELDLAPFDALRRLSITCDLGDHNNIRQIISLAVACTALGEIWVYSADGRRYPSPDTIDFLRALPSSIHFIYLPELHLSTEYLLDVLSDPRALRSLKELELDRRQSPEGNGPMVSARSGREAAAIVAAGRRRGIEVECEAVDDRDSWE